MVKLTLDITKTLEQNAANYFEKAKKAKRKIEGAEGMLERAKAKLKVLVENELKEESPPEEIEEAQNRREKKAQEQWYEKFRWFVSSEDFLVVGGRDATTNEIVIKKHTDNNDVVFHTDMAGSPFFVVKSAGKTPGELTLQEVTNAVFTFSRAAKLGLAAAGVFWVTPAQVSKQPNQGEFLPKGAFMIRGKTNYLSPSFDLAIGLNEDGKIMAGPRAAVKKHCEKQLVLERDEGAKPSDTAKRIRHILGGDLDTIIRCLPSCGASIQKEKFRPSKNN